MRWWWSTPPVKNRPVLGFFSPGPPKSPGAAVSSWVGAGHHRPGLRDRARSPGLLPTVTACGSPSVGALGLEPPGFVDAVAGELRIEQVAQPVTEQVEAEDRHHDRGAGIQHEPRRLLEVESAVGQDVAPRRYEGRHAHPEERERGLGEHGRREDEAPL